MEQLFLLIQLVKYQPAKQSVRQNMRKYNHVVQLNAELRTKSPLATVYMLRMMCYSVMTQAYSEKEIPSSPNRS